MLPKPTNSVEVTDSQQPLPPIVRSMASWVGPRKKVKTGMPSGLEETRQRKRESQEGEEQPRCFERRLPRRREQPAPSRAGSGRHAVRKDIARNGTPVPRRTSAGEDVVSKRSRTFGSVIEKYSLRKRSARVAIPDAHQPRQLGSREWLQPSPIGASRWSSRKSSRTEKSAWRTTRTDTTFDKQCEACRLTLTNPPVALTAGKGPCKTRRSQLDRTRTSLPKNWSRGNPHPHTASVVRVNALRRLVSPRTGCPVSSRSRRGF